MPRRSHPRRTAATLLAVALLGGGHALATADAAPVACTADPHPSGEWPSYGNDLANTRSQTDGIPLTAVADIEPALVVDIGGLVNSTPVVDGGCVFVAANGQASTVATITVLDADLGSVVWTRAIVVGTPAFGGAQVGSPALWGDLVIVPFNKRAAPFVAAFDRSTGVERWRATIDTQPSSGTNASLIVHDGIVFAGFFGSAGPWQAERGGFVLLEAETGAKLATTFSIPDADFDADDRVDTYAGAGIWATPVVDDQTGYAYVGTSNPHNPRREHSRSNALLKIDLDRSRATFGEIVAHYKGIHDTVVPGAQDQPVCEAAPGVNYYGNFSATCLAVDVDFGASPNLFRSGNRTLLGSHQKSGVYHVVDTADMSGVSMTPVGVPCFACSAATSAVAEGRAFVPAGPPGQMVAVDVTHTVGAPLWASPIAGGFTYNPVSVADGLAWSVDSLGFLNAYETRTGAPVVKRAMADDTGQRMQNLTTSSGIAIARQRLYVAATQYLIVYGTGDQPGGVAPAVR